MSNISVTSTHDTDTTAACWLLEGTKITPVAAADFRSLPRNKQVITVQKKLFLGLMQSKEALKFRV